MPHAVERSAGRLGAFPVSLTTPCTAPVPRPADQLRPATTEISMRDKPAPAPTYRVTPVREPIAWKALGAGHPLRSIFCSWGWGTYKEATGWTVERLRIDAPDGRPFAICAVSTKCRLGLRLFHIQGGPLVLDSDDDERIAQALEALIAHVRPRPLDVIMLHTYAFRTDALLFALLSSGFSPIMGRADFTVTLDLSGGTGPIRKSMGRRWKRSLRSAATRLTARFPENEASRLAAMQRFAPMYHRLAERKRFGARTSVSDLAKVVASDDRYVILEVLDGEEVVAIRIAHTAGDLLTEFLAATTEAGLESKAGYFAMWSMVEKAAAMGLKRFDCGGIDPWGSPGVFQFKRGIARQVKPSGPIWLWSRSRLVRNAVQAYMAWS